MDDLENWASDYILGSFIVLSDDIVYHIFEYLNPRELTKVMLVSKNFRRIADDQQVTFFLASILLIKLWQAMCFRYYHKDFIQMKAEVDDWKTTFINLCNP